MAPTILGFSSPPPSLLHSPLSTSTAASRIIASLLDLRPIGARRADSGRHRATLKGVCRASQAVDFFSSTRSEIVVRDARIEDCWEVADTHCSSFFPNYIFPLDLVLRVDRFIALLSGFTVPTGCMRVCLVAVTCAIGDKIYFGSEESKVGDLEGNVSFGRGSVAGILTVDTLADFLPRKGPLQKRRTGIAYLSNVAVREAQRRRGIAKRLVVKAEARARFWGCRAIALHCETSNLAAAQLYGSLGFKSIKVPEHANWPEPKIKPDSQFIFMMKLLSSASYPER